MEAANQMLEPTIQKQRLELSISHKIFSLPVIEKTLFLLRGLITDFEVTDTSSDNIRICITIVSTGAAHDIEDLFYNRLVSTAVSLMHEENNRDIKQYFVQTAMTAMIEPQRDLKRHLVAQAREDSRSQTNRVIYWDQYKGYCVELGGGVDIFVEEDANVFHFDLDRSIYSPTHTQSVVDKVVDHSVQCAIRVEGSRIIVTITFQERTTESIMLKTLLDLQKALRVLRQDQI